jgi:hypothetical protein
MRFVRSWLSLSVAFLAAASLATAQTTNGTVSGRVVDSQQLVLPGVTVTASSPALQGVRTATTSENGDYLFTLLPPGAYTVTFELSGFQRVQRTVTLAPTQTLPLDIAMGPAAISETVDVVGRTAAVPTGTVQVATNFRQELIEALPTTRDINASVLMAPGVHPTGPGGAYSIAGGVSFENLFMVNGVSVNENLRGQPFDLYIEDAIQETSVASAGIAAEYGRFSGGIVNVITKSGGNRFSGSFRNTLYNDRWRTLTPFEQTAIANDPQHQDLRIDNTVPAYEYTLGGPVVKDRLWFFTAGRMQTQESGRTLAFTNIPYTYTDRIRRYEGNATYSPAAGHRVQGDYIRIDQTQINNTFSQQASMDLASLNTREVPEDLFTLNYSGILSPNFFLEARFSSRHWTSSGDGAPTTELVGGTLLLDLQTGGRYWSDTFCGVCDPESRDNSDVFVKGSYFFSKRGSGTHTLAFGFDSFNDKRFANNHQSGSDYRIFGTSTILQGSGAESAIYPMFLGNATFIQWNPITLSTLGTNFRTHSVFVSDDWRVNSRLTAVLGLRFDKNHGVDGSGHLVANDSAWSPRLGLVFDPTGAQTWTVSTSFARYVAPVINSLGDASSPGGNSDRYLYLYKGPSINANPNGTLTPTADAVAQVFDWFFANGGTNSPFLGPPAIRGVTPQILDSLTSPNVLEYAAGVNRQFGSRAAARLDFVYRDFHDFYAQRTDLTTGRVQDPFGRSYDLSVLENTDTLKRRYTGLSAQVTYRIGPRTDVGGNYTISHAWGTFDGEALASGPAFSDTLVYPEYKQASWNSPEGDLAIDQRHRARLWINYGLPWVDGLTVSALQDLATGVPYGAVSTSGVNAAAYVTNPGYLTPPTGPQTTYYFTARDAYRTEGTTRTDIAVNYSRRVSRAHNVELFGQVQVLNIFNQFKLCGCGATVFSNGGAVRADRLNQTVLTPVTAPTKYQTFNPFTTTPVQGVNWDLGSAFGQALNQFAYTSPRTLRLSFGVRF